MSKIQGKSVLLRVRADFELPRVRVIRVGLYNFFIVLGLFMALYVMENFERN